MTATTERHGSAPALTNAGNAGDARREPPQNMEAEQSVLGGMLLSKDAIADVVEVLTPQDFYRPNHQVVYESILDLYGRGEPADAVTVAAELDRRGLLRRIGDAPYLHTLISLVPTAANAGYYAGIVAEKAVLRRLVQAGTRVVQYGYAGADGAEVADIVDRAQAEMFDVTNRTRSEDMVALEDLLQPTMDEIDALATGGRVRGIPTGFIDIDQTTNGLQAGQLVIIAARPGVGKALAIDTVLPTPHGWTTMGEVSVGDQLLGADGHPTRVVAATDVMHERPCYTVEFSDGTSIVADHQHQWPTSRGILTTAELRCEDRLVAVQPLELPPIPNLPATHVVARWMLGVDVAGIDAAVVHRYLRASLGQRRALHSELVAAQAVATGSWRDAKCHAASLELARTLGHAPDHRGHSDSREHSDHGNRTITGIRPHRCVPVRCVQVDNPAHLYLAGTGMVPTHNSTLGLDFLRSCSIKHQQASVIFSLEMSKSEIVMRLLSAEAKINLSDLRSGRMDDDKWAALARCMGDISEAPLYIDDSPNLTMTEIRAKARRLAQQRDLKLIVIDYLQLMTSGKKYESRQQEVSDFSRSLKLLAKELHVPVVAISQLNRGPEQRTDKRPVVSDLRESGAIEQDADMIMLLHRPDAIDPDDPRAGEADVDLAKHRNGPTRRFSLAHQLHFSRFCDMARDI